MSGNNSRGVWWGGFFFTLWRHASMLEANDREKAKTPARAIPQVP